MPCDFHVIPDSMKSYLMISQGPAAAPKRFRKPPTPAPFPTDRCRTSVHTSDLAPSQTLEP